MVRINRVVVLDIAAARVPHIIRILGRPVLLDVAFAGACTEMPRVRVNRVVIMGIASARVGR